ncbi:MAG: homoserine O-acetyltransferase [Planctomycetes bacterium]|nr:homoserine O-acetyltransferase [Planctomycetota bacterium]
MAIDTAPGIGLVTTRDATVCPDGLRLDCGRTLGPITVAWEQYGAPDPDNSNVVLVCHALSGGAHAAGWHDAATKPGWWDVMIGPGKAFDTRRYCVISSNVLGSCYGTTGPVSVDPATGQPFGPEFPVVTVWDMVRVQRRLLEHLGITSLAAVAGGSMGGMQALAWSVLYPGFAESIIAIASTDRHSAQQIAFNEVARRAIFGDPAWRSGRYSADRPPETGLTVARMLGHITYLSDTGMERKFGRRVRGRLGYALGSPEFEVERYLEHQGASFVGRFDANALLYLTKAIDYFDLGEGEDSLEAALAKTASRFLLLTFSSDWLYPPYQLERVAAALESAGRPVEYHCLKSDYGHDAFLLEHAQQEPIVRRFLVTSGFSGSSTCRQVGPAALFL